MFAPIPEPPPPETWAEAFNHLAWMFRETRRQELERRKKGLPADMAWLAHLGDYGAWLNAAFLAHQRGEELPARPPIPAMTSRLGTI